MTDRELMQQALEALEEINKLSVGENAICLPAEIDTAMDALRERLAQPEPKHHQYPLQSDRMRIDPVTGDVGIGTPIAKPVQQEPVAVYVGETWCGSVVRLYVDLPLETPFYTSPQPSKPWVGLTEFDIDQIPYSCSHADSRLIAYAIEAKLKEKNA